MTETAGRYSAIVLGGTGNVGGRIVQWLLESPRCERVVVVTRRPTGAFPHPKAAEVVVHMDRLEQELLPHAQGIDVALAAFGIGQGSGRMAEEEVRRIEAGYPRAFFRAARAGGARVASLMSAMGADATSRVQYLRIMGEKEQAVATLGFDFLALHRPAMILGNSNTPRYLEALMPWLHWAMPSRYRSIHKNDLARAMVRRSEEALAALAEGRAPAGPASEVLEYAAMERYFVPGAREKP